MPIGLDKAMLENVHCTAKTFETGLHCGKKAEGINKTSNRLKSMVDEVWLENCLFFPHVDPLAFLEDRSKVT